MAFVFKRKNAAGKVLPKYYIKYRDRHGEWKVVAGTTSKNESLKQGRTLEDKETLIANGVVVPESRPTPSKDELKTLVKSYAESLRFKGDTESHIDLTVQQITSIFEGCDFTKLRDLQGDRPRDKVIEYLQNKKRASKRRPLKETTKRNRKPPERAPEELGVISARTRKLYLASLKGFCRWCVDDGKFTAATCKLLAIKAGTQKAEAKGAPPVERRAASDAEVRKLLKATLKGGDVEGLTGEERYYLYRTALGTGYRASELASLYPASFMLGKATPVIKLEWVDAKDGSDTGPKSHNQPIHPDLARELRDWLKGRDVDSPVWPGDWNKKAAKMLRTDLRAAGVPHEVAAGVLDFHALRVTFITSLAEAGVHPKTAQDLARHSDINLTMKVYTKVGEDKIASAVPPPVSV